LWRFWPDRDSGRAEILTDQRFVGNWVVSYNLGNPQVSMWELQITGTGNVSGVLWGQSDNFEEVSWWTREPSELCVFWTLRLEDDETVELTV